MVNVIVPHLNVRWLGTLDYDQSLYLQRSLIRSPMDYLLLLEHPPVYTFGLRYRSKSILDNVIDAGKFNTVQQVVTDRGGDVTFHGPGQLVGYPILTVGEGKANVRQYVEKLQETLIAILARIGLKTARLIEGVPGVFVPSGNNSLCKIASVGIRATGSKVMHGFALNNTVDLTYFESINPCGISEYKMTSLSEIGLEIDLADLIDVTTETFVDVFERRESYSTSFVVDKLSTYKNVDDAIYEIDAPTDTVEETAKVAPAITINKSIEVMSSERSSVNIPLPSSFVRLAKSKSDLDRAKTFQSAKPSYLKKKLTYNQDVIALKSKLKQLNLVTVCQEASCPNLSECWSNSTATFMIAGDICTRACGFCDVKTGKPQPLNGDEPSKVAQAVNALNLNYAVITSVDRDDLKDLGLSHWVDTINQVRFMNPATKIEVLIPDFKGNTNVIDGLIEARPDILNHNMETVARLHKAVRPSASYGRSLSLLAQSQQSGLITKSGFMVGLGETNEEVFELIKDLYATGVSIVTIGQYLRPSIKHLPVMRYVSLPDFALFKKYGESMGIPHIESSPFTRSSYHAEGSATAYLYRSSIGGNS